MKSLKILIEQHSDGYVAYPLGIPGSGRWAGDAYEEALAAEPAKPASPWLW